MSFLRNLFAKRYAKILSISTLSGFTYLAYHYYPPAPLQLPVSNQDNASESSITSNNNQAPLPSNKVNQNGDPSGEMELKQQKKQVEVNKQQSKQQQKVAEVNVQNAVLKQQEQIKQLKLFARLSQIKQYKLQYGLQEQLVLIIADLPFNEAFQKKIVDTINKIKTNNSNVKIYRKDILQTANRQSLKAKYKATIKEQTLFLLKNAYDPKMNNIDFDIFTQYPDIIDLYLKPVHYYNSHNASQLLQKIASLSPHQSTLLYLYDQQEPEQKVRQRLMTAKFVEMELLVNNLKGINVQVIDRNVAIANHLIDQSSSRTNSLHLFRKHNKYTPFDPNYKLKAANTAIDFHRLSDIALFRKGSNALMIPSYLSALETFDSQQLAAPYLCTLKVDRNKISEHDYNRLLKIFGGLKKNGVFPDVGFGLQLKEIGYLGKEVPVNKCWQIAMISMDELDKESMMYQIKTKRQLQALGIKQQQYLKTTNQYLYEHNVIDQQLIQSFIGQSSKGLLKKYHKSQQKNVLSNLSKLVASNYPDQVINNDFDHLIYEYSESCPTCKKISPIISAFQNIIREKEYGLSNLMFHRMDANKNRTPHLMASPYIPNIYYLKKEWKECGPVRFPIDFFNRYGVSSLFYFCLISKQIKSIPWDLVNKAVETAEKYKSLNV